MDKTLLVLDSMKRVEMELIMVPEGKQLFLFMTVKENLLMGAYKARTKMSKNLAFVLKMFPKLKERINQEATTLSVGEQQMLAIAR
jgi:branched-chain amino acid transport system ATP-binding protein